MNNLKIEGILEDLKLVDRTRDLLDERETNMLEVLKEK